MTQDTLKRIVDLLENLSVAEASSFGFTLFNSLIPCLAFYNQDVISDDGQITVEENDFLLNTYLTLAFILGTVDKETGGYLITIEKISRNLKNPGLENVP